MLSIYRMVVGLLFYCSLPISLLFVWLSGRHRQGLLQRFGHYPETTFSNSADKIVWVHAASVGEVQAARPVIAALRKQLENPTIILTTMTLAGRKVAEKQLDPAIKSYLAPLDVPGIVERAIRKLKPTIYICIETELWPLLLDALSRRKIFLGMVNGRLSSNSYARYRLMGSFLAHILRKFDRMSVISKDDCKKYISLGAHPWCLSVGGNVKYDFNDRGNAEEIVNTYKRLLKITTEEVFIAGSTHDDEEVKLLAMYKKLTPSKRHLFVLAPRHLERLGSLERIMRLQGVEFHLLSALKNGVQKREKTLILVDTMGDLADLYGVADFIFCGGSLVEKGGHNLLEAAIWGKAVFYGACIDDFQDGADLLESVQGGFKVADVIDLENHMNYFREHIIQYHEACRRAGEIAKAQQGSSSRQVKHILDGFFSYKEDLED